MPMRIARDKCRTFHSSYSTHRTQTLHHMASSASAASNGHGDGGYISDSSSSSSSSSSEPAPTPILDEQFLPRILSLFFAIFHPTEGPKIVYQVPEGSVSCGREGSKRTSEHNAKSNNTLHNPECLFEFETLSDYLIPKAALCGRLITCTTRGSGTSSNGDTPNRSQSRSRTRTPASSPTQTKHYKVLSYPVLLEDSAKYERNTFIFNLAFVFDGKADVKSYEPVVRKCARALRGLEVSEGGGCEWSDVVIWHPLSSTRNLLMPN